MRSFILTVGFLFLISSLTISQTKYDTIYSYVSNLPIVVDGQADEACWNQAEWFEIGQTWIPYGANVPASDFEGRFKVSWDSDYLYLLVEIHDDSLSDDHSDPLQNFWDDDCVEIFIDENRSLGNHQTNNNAFAYHVSLVYDAIDLNSSGGGINYKYHISVDMDTIAEDLYLWEFAIKLYDASYNNSNPEASRVFPEHNKIMGFSLAYCDNDETTSRENFFGTMTLTSSTANNSYIDATIFGVMKLIDPEAVSVKNTKGHDPFSFYPNPANEYILLDKNGLLETMISLYSMDGKKIMSSMVNSKISHLDISQLEPGSYFLRSENQKGVFSKKLIIE